MSEQTFRSPGFFEQEIELTAPGAQPTGTPGGFIGAAAGGPAFVPTTVASFSDYQARFGGLDQNYPATYAANEWLKHKGALTFIRVLGAGSNASSADFAATLSQGTVLNAGFKLSGATATVAGDNRVANTVQFLVARHSLPASATPPSEWQGFPVFSDNPSFNPGLGDTINVVRGVLMFPTSSRGMVLDMTGAASQWTGTGASIDDVASTDASSSSSTFKKFKLAISSSLGSLYATTDNVAGVRMMTASFDPSSNDYFGKILNTDPRKFQEEQHLLYLDFPVENELAPLDTAGDSCVAIASGSSAYLGNFGRFDTRFTSPRTTSFISQPFGSTEYDLFHFETISDGAISNNSFKISIANVKASSDPSNPYGTFDVMLRELYDTDTSTRVLESFTGCDLNPSSQNYVAKKIGDKKVTFNFDMSESSEQRLLISGKFPNVSRRIRVIVSERVSDKTVPSNVLPFGFRGVPVIRTTQTLTDTEATLSIGGASYGTAGSLPRLRCVTAAATGLTGSIVPPLPFRFKATRGVVDGTAYIGAPGILEIPDSRFHWGVKFEKLQSSGSTSGKVLDAVMDSNGGLDFNPLIAAYSKMQGIQKLDTLITGSHADAFNANKFTLARVALSNQTIADVTGTVDAHMKEAAYVRNGTPNSFDYRITDTTLNRLTFASLLSDSANTFNKFSEYAKFSNIFYGGFDGVNILDEAASLLGDKATSTELGGRAASGAAATSVTGLGYNPGGSELSNNAVYSYRIASKLMTDPMTTSVNVIATPGVRDPLVTDYIMSRLSSYALAMYVIDIPNYSDSNTRIFAGSGVKPNVTRTADALTSRSPDNNYIATYFPDVFINDQTSGHRVNVPASVAAIGALAYSDKVSYPWYAPAGFNRAALDFVANVDVRLSTSDRDYLYENRINPIATFPGSGFVIFGQKTLQLSKSAFDRVNVRRLFLELKRVIQGVARGLLFEPNDATTRTTFINRATPLLSLIKAQSGVDQFRIIMDDTNNSQSDVAASKLNGRIIVVPTRAVEFIAVDFIITPAGVEFV